MHVSTFCFKLTASVSFQQASDGLQLAGHVKDLNSPGQCLPFPRENSLLHLALLQCILSPNRAITKLRFQPCCPLLHFLINRTNLPADQKMYAVQLCQKEDRTCERISVAREVLCCPWPRKFTGFFFLHGFLVSLVQFRSPCF